MLPCIVLLTEAIQEYCKCTNIRTVLMVIIVFSGDLPVFDEICKRFLRFIAFVYITAVIYLQFLHGMVLYMVEKLHHSILVETLILDELAITSQTVTDFLE